MGAVFLGLFVMALVAIAWAIVTAMELAMERCGRGSAETAPAPSPAAVPVPAPDPETFHHAVRFYNSIHRVECAWCGEMQQPGIEPVSHGICPQCAQEHFPHLDLSKEVRG